MRRLTILIVFAVTTISLLAFRPATTTDSKGVEGVWKSIHVTATNPEGTEEIGDTQPNILIFTGKHYAEVRVRGDEVREELPEDATDEQLLAAWRQFRASAGMYQVTGNEITTKVIVAKSPNAMAEQRERTTTFEMDEDTMYRTFTSRDGTRTFRVEYVRVE